MKPLPTQFRAVVLVASARLLLRRRGTTATLRRLGPPGNGSIDVDPQQALRAVRRAARLVGGDCLPQAVALTALLKKGGHEPALILGCRKNRRGGWSAHAWVEIDQDVLEPGGGTGFARLAQLSAQNDWVPSPLTSS